VGKNRGKRVNAQILHNSNVTNERMKTARKLLANKLGAKALDKSTFGSMSSNK
jgi:hypothetical protein